MAGDPRRITHQFDFDERDDGNLEDVPKYWVPLRPGGFPSFTRGRFDLEVGHLAPPSFYLDCDGRNVAYQYAGPETRVRANTDYRIEAYLKPDQLYHARACLSAHFLDERGNPVEGTLVRSRYVGGPEDNDQWIRIELFLHNAPQRAQTIGLIGWVLQREMWDMSKPPKRHIPRKDVRAGMWLDDITIYALPRVELKTSAPGNVLGPDDINEIHVVLADNEDRNLWGKLTVATAAGQTIRTHHVRAVLNEASAIERINVADLPPGMYQARLEVQSGETIVGVRTLDFARLGDLHRSAKAPARSFGISIDPRWRQESKVELALLNHQAIRSVKLPVWTGLPGTGASVAEMRDVDRLIQGLIKRNFAITGVFHGPPSEIVRSDGPYARSLMALLADDPSVWQEYLASVVAPYATVFRWWQLGGDGGEGVVAGPELTTATSQFREAMRRFITTPSISLPVSAAIAPGDNRLPAEHITVTLDARLDPDYFAHDIKTFTKLGFDHVAVHVPPLPTSKYQPAQRVADWARRLIVARHGGARTAYAPQTWRVRETWYGRIAEPKEEYLVLRTIADVVGDALPMGAVQAPPGVKCLMFVDGDSVVMAAWDTLAPPAGSRYTLQLGQAARMIDLAGRSFPLDRDEHNRQIVYLSATPILIDNIDRWIVEFRNSLAIETLACGVRPRNRQAHAYAHQQRQATDFRIRHTHRTRGSRDQTARLHPQPAPHAVGPARLRSQVRPQRTRRHQADPCRYSPLRPNLLLRNPSKRRHLADRCRRVRNRDNRRRCPGATPRRHKLVRPGPTLPQYRKCAGPGTTIPTRHGTGPQRTTSRRIPLPRRRQPGRKGRPPRSPRTERWPQNPQPRTHGTLTNRARTPNPPAYRYVACIRWAVSARLHATHVRD